MEVIIRDQARRRQFWWPRDFEQTMKIPLSKNGRRRRLFCRNGVYLRVTADKHVAGTTNPFDPTVVFDLIPAGGNSIKIQNVKSGLYVAIDQNGDIMTKPHADSECVFEETNNSNFYDIFKRPRSVGPPFVLGLCKNGEAESTLYRGKKQAKFSEFCFISQLIYCSAYSADHAQKKCTEILSDQTDSPLIYSTTRKRVVASVTRQEPVQTRKLRAAHYYTKKQ
ncbi:fibroblast growth factor 1-like [Dendronephthya gigantea]|uniref:fibroblast growth factor 1-like n=1 Tax=Dendronephthya gigantea TaxID=151771 RepID=UPI00106D98F7|nr:fibroblast growth factor 1-like [Dendronephthya gigantea]